MRRTFISFGSVVENAMYTKKKLILAEKEVIDEQVSFKDTYKYKKAWHDSVVPVPQNSELLTHFFRFILCK